MAFVLWRALWHRSSGPEFWATGLDRDELKERAEDLHQQRMRLWVLRSNRLIVTTLGVVVSA